MRGPVGYATSADRSRHRPAWLPLAAAALVVPTVLAGLTLLWPRPQIEDGLERAATGSLAAAGLTGTGVTFSGRDALLTGVSGPEAQRAVDVVEDVPGVRVATAPVPGAPEAPAPGGPGGQGPGAGPGAAATGPFGIVRRGEEIVLTGVVGSEEERTALVAAATEQAGGRTVVDELTVTPGALPQPGVTAASVGTTAALLGAASDGVAASIDGDTLTLTGTAPDSASAQAAGQALSTALPGTTVDNQLTASGGGTAPSGELDDAGKRELQTAIDSLTGAAPVTFEPNSPTLTATGAATVDGVVRLAARVPGARLQVDGFVATGPGDGRLTAQELSDQRAATVRDALVAGGVPGENIVARGLGEGDSPAAQAAGRRVQITVV